MYIDYTLEPLAQLNPIYVVNTLMLGGTNSVLHHNLKAIYIGYDLICMWMQWLYFYNSYYM